jgi:hypothetical protein
LKGKLHFYVGERDEFYRNLAVHRFEEFLRSAQPSYGGTFQYSSREGHGWQPTTNADLVKLIVNHIKSVAPGNAPSAWSHN